MEDNFAHPFTYLSLKGKQNSNAQYYQQTLLLSTIGLGKLQDPNGSDKEVAAD